MQLTIRTYRIIPTASRRARRLRRPATFVACAIVPLAAPGVASAADTVIAPDPSAAEVAALDGTVVWSSGASNDQVLMQRTPDGVIARVKGAPRAPLYHSIDLGHDHKGRLVLSYQRCDKNTCKGAILDDLHGRRTSFRHLTLTRCSLTTAPAVWRARLAYGLSCRKPNRQIDAKRSGLYVKTGAGSPRRLRLPKDAARFGATSSRAVDLRGTLAAAITADIYEYAFSETIHGRGLRSLRVAASEGDSNQHATGLSLGSGGVMWTLVNAEHSGDPNQAIIFKVQSRCYETERLVNPADPDQESGFRATDLAVDRSTLYLVVPGTGIVTHDFAPERMCTPL